MAVHAYVLVGLVTSSAEEAAAIKAQQRTIDVYAWQRNLLIDNCLLERRFDASVPLAERSRGNHILSLLEPGDVLLAARRDLLFATPDDAIQTCRRIQLAQASVHLVDLDADVTAAFARLAELEGDKTADALAEVERELIGQRDARRVARYHTGRIPFGYHVEQVVEGSGVVKYLVVDALQQQALSLMRELHKRRTSLRSIAEQVQTRLGVVISHEQVRRLLGVKAEPERPYTNRGQPGLWKRASVREREKALPLIREMHAAGRRPRQIIEQVYRQYGLVIGDHNIRDVLNAGEAAQHDVQSLIEVDEGRALDE
jgi:hypothetical protein